MSAAARRRARGISAAVLLATSALVPPPAWPAGDQPDHVLFRVDAARTGHLPAGPQPPLRLRWKFQTRESEARIEAYPPVDDGLSPATAAGGVVYAGGHDGWVYALDARTGRKLWDFRTQGHVMSAPTLHDGRLFVGSRDGFFYALDPATGAVLWKHESGYKPWNGIRYGGVRATPIVAGGRVVFGGCDGRYRALDERTGAELWRTDSGEVGAYSSPALAGGTIFVGNGGRHGGALHALDPATGVVKWRFPVPGQIFSTPAVRDGVVFFHARNDHVYALGAADGRQLWQVPAPSPRTGPASSRT